MQVCNMQKNKNRQGSNANEQMAKGPLMKMELFKSTSLSLANLLPGLRE